MRLTVLLPEERSLAINDSLLLPARTAIVGDGLIVEAVLVDGVDTDSQSDSVTHIWGRVDFTSDEAFSPATGIVNALELVVRSDWCPVEFGMIRGARGKGKWELVSEAILSRLPPVSASVFVPRL